MRKNSGKHRSRFGFLTSLLALTLAIAVLAGCSGGSGSKGGSDPAPKPGETPAQTGPKTGGTLIVGRPTDAISLDPHQESTSPGNWVMSNMLETLVVMTQESEFVPGLAEKWEQVAPDRWRFHLRKGVKFHDGTDFNAQAVKFSIERITDKEKPGRMASNLVFIKDIEVKDDHTVDIVTDGPYGPMLNMMSIVYATGVVSPTAVQKHGEDFGRNPVGTGPFKYVDWKTNNEIVIERFDGYWGEKALLDKVVYRVIPEESARMLALERGEIHVAMNPAPSQIETLKGDKSFTVHEVPGVRVVYFGFNLNKAPLDDVRVRQAMNHGTNRQEIVDNILEGAAVTPTAYISPGVVGYKDVSQYWAYDPDKAAKLLDEAGWKMGSDGFRYKDGKKLATELWTPKGRYLKDAESAEAWQGQMKKIGVDVEVKVLEWGTIFTQLRAGANHEAPMFTLGWSTATGDADYTLAPLFTTENLPPRGWNSYNYSNARVDELGPMGRTSTDPAERKKIYGEMLEILAKEAVLVPIYNSKEVIITSTKVKGFKIHPIDYFLWWDKVWLDQ